MSLRKQWTTIAKIASLKTPARIGPTRATPFQRQLWRMRTIVDRYRIASNGEIVLSLYSIDSGQYMNAYLPNPHCLGARARDRTGMIAARRELTSHCPQVTAAWQLIGVTVEVAGVGFWNPVTTTRGACAKRRGAAAAHELQDHLRLRSRQLSVAATRPERSRTRRAGVSSVGAFAVKQRVRLSLFVLLALLLSILLIGLLASYNLYRSAEDHYIGLALPLRTASRDVLFQMEREETGVRGYIITSNRTSLEPYRRGREGVLEDLRQIARLTKGHPELSGRLDEVRREVIALHGFYDRLIVFVADGPVGRERAIREVPAR